MLCFLFFRFFTKKLGNVPEKVTEFALALTLDKFPLTIAVVIVGIALATCGALGFAVGLFFFLVKVLKLRVCTFSFNEIKCCLLSYVLFQIFKSYQDVLDDILRKEGVNLGEIFSASNFHFHCAMLWFVITAINLPSLIYWIHNFK